MEAVKSRSESPFSRSKAKSQFSDADQNLDVEQMKAKKKSLRNKCKSQSNGSENEDLTDNGKDFFEEKASTNEAFNNSDSNNGEHEIRINNGDNGEIENENKKAQEIKDKNDVLISACEVKEENIVTEISNQITVTGAAEEFKTTENATAVEITECCKEQSIDNKSETESNVKENNLSSCELQLKSEVECESCENKWNGETHDISKEDSICSPQEEEITKESSKIKDSSQISVNGSEGSSHYEEANAVEDYIQSSPDTATKSEESFSHKITHFLGKWSYPQDQKEDSEVSSSKKFEATLNHPYLSKVSGRKGIKDRLNSSATVFGSSGLEAKTPECIGISLNDSFRVRTNPSRLIVSHMENPTLRKFKGKRCLNTGDEEEPEDEDDIHANVLKRRKLDDKTQESGILGTIFWSPFRKKSLDSEDHLKLATTESKLSRLLSPFWFWKKTAAGQKGK